MKRFAAPLIALLFLCNSALAWSNKEHIQLTRLAAERLLADPTTPPAMKQWLTQATPDATDLTHEHDFFLHAKVGSDTSKFTGLACWSTMPDHHAETDPKTLLIEPFHVRERQLHFLDVEYFKPNLPTPEYRHDLSAKPDLADFPRDLHDPRYQKAGMLPFRVEDCFNRLVSAIKENRLLEAPDDNHALRWAGYLAHYAADNTQPHHATLDYKSLAYVPHPLNAPNIHMQMEYVMSDDREHDHMPLRQEYWPIFIKKLSTLPDPIQTDDPWQSTLQVLLTSYDALPLIGQAARAAASPDGQFDTEAFFHFKGTYQGQEMTVLEMKARQQAWAVHRIQRLWRQAWLQASR